MTKTMITRAMAGVALAGCLAAGAAGCNKSDDTSSLGGIAQGQNNHGENGQSSQPPTSETPTPSSPTPGSSIDTTTPTTPGMGSGTGGGGDFGIKSTPAQDDQFVDKIAAALGKTGRPSSSQKASLVRGGKAICMALGTGASKDLIAKQTGAMGQSGIDQKTMDVYFKSAVEVYCPQHLGKL